MAGSAHTPGPWAIDFSYSSPTYVRAACGDMIASVHVVYQRRDLPYLDNARLIAAAPDLLALVTEIYGFWADVDMSERQLLQAFARLAPEMNAAIAKAEGK